MTEAEQRLIQGCDNYFGAYVVSYGTVHNSICEQRELVGKAMDVIAELSTRIEALEAWIRELESEKA